MKLFKNILIFVAFIGIATMAGQDLIVNTMRLDGFVYGNKSGSIDSLIVPDSDSLGQYKYQNAKDPTEPLDLVNLRTLLSSGSSGVDSIPFNPATGNQEMYFSGAVTYTANFDNRYVRIQDSTQSDTYNYVNFNALNDSLHVRDLLINEIETSTTNVFPIIMPIAGTLSGSVALMVEGTDYPTGWTIVANGTDLEIEHNLSRYSSGGVSIAYNYSGDLWREIRGFNDGFQGHIYDDDNTTVEGVKNLYTAYKMRITLIFE